MIILLLILAFVLRLALLSLPSFATDMNSWISWANHMVAVGPVGFYQTIWSDYAPGYLYVLWFLGWIHRLVPAVPYEIILKLPAVLADVGIGYLIYQITRSQKFALLVAALYLFNPAVIFNSAIWGQVDAVSTFFVMVGIWLIGRAGEIRWIRGIGGFFFLGLAIVVKPQSMVFVPIIFLYSVMRVLKTKARLWLSVFKWLLAFVAPIMLLSWPFFVSSPLTGLVEHLAGSASTYPYASVNAMNLWGVFANWKVDSSTFLSFSYGVWGLTLFSIMYLACLRRQVFSIKYFYNKSDKNFFLSLALIAVSFFMLLTRMHERYLHPFFALMVLAIGAIGVIRKMRGFIVIYIGLTVLHFFNLYYAYSYYNHNFLRIDAVTNFVGKYFGWFSAATVILYGVLVLYLVQLTYQKRTTSS